MTLCNCVDYSWNPTSSSYYRISKSDIEFDSWSDNTSQQKAKLVHRIIKLYGEAELKEREGGDTNQLSSNIPLSLLTRTLLFHLLSTSPTLLALTCDEQQIARILHQYIQFNSEEIEQQDSKIDTIVELFNQIQLVKTRIRNPVTEEQKRLHLSTLNLMRSVLNLSLENYNATEITAAEEDYAVKNNNTNNKNNNNNNNTTNPPASPSSKKKKNNKGKDSKASTTDVAEAVETADANPTQSVPLRYAQLSMRLGYALLDKFPRVSNRSFHPSNYTLFRLLIVFPLFLHTSVYHSIAEYLPGLYQLVY